MVFEERDGGDGLDFTSAFPADEGYRHTLEKLGNEKCLLGRIFTNSQNKFQDPAKLRCQLVDLLPWRAGVPFAEPVRAKFATT